ncbi:MAG: PspA/IM30 family protein [Nitrosomonas sp.]|nr:PspA/IM30 family protein [Nitrosomonas sp.]MCP5252243.1 PspA/IM30 family protein [Burkholderiales bacterium]HQU61646.1 PspA/IM30 family protein [Nitrosomonas sp.]
MSILKRLSTTLISRIDRVVTEIENHDAVIQAALNEMNSKMAKAKIALNQACRERDRIKTELETQQSNVHRWQERAIICAKTDESKALECLRRSHKSRDRAAMLQKSLDEYTRSIEKMTGNIQSSAQRLNEMKQRLTLMRAKQATSKTDATAHSNCGDAESIVEDTFNRWEMHLNHDDIPLDCTTDDMDELEHAFITQEQQNDLRSELTALLTREKQQ